jgi:hypothetical protein
METSLVQEININYLKNVSTFKYEILGNGHIADLFRKEEYQIDNKSERSYTINNKSDKINIPIDGMGTIGKIIVIVPRYKSAILSFCYDNFWDGKKVVDQYLTDYSVMSLDPKKASSLLKLQLSTEEADLTRITINMYSFLPPLDTTQISS